MPLNKLEEEKQTPTLNTWAAPSAPLLITVIILLALVLLGGAFSLGRHENRMMPGQFSTQKAGLLGTRPEFGRHMTRDFLNNSNHVMGVVTQVNGDHFSVAGNGATKDVQTDSSTQYTGGSEVKVNDTVVIMGTTTNNQFTAERIVINP